MAVAENVKTRYVYNESLLFRNLGGTAEYFVPCREIYKGFFYVPIHEVNREPGDIPKVCWEICPDLRSKSWTIIKKEKNNERKAESNQRRSIETD